MVIGISLASYITLSSRAMQLSNRSFQAGVSKQLAEVGIEEALRAFNQNNWDDWTSSGFSTDWTLDTTNKRATATMTFPAGKFGQGTTATVKVRVDNYDAAHLGTSWSSGKSYRINDLVGYNGVWYRSVADSNLNHTPGVTDLAWWVPAPIVWTWSSNTDYTAYQDVVCYGGSWWLCDTTHTSGSSFTWSNWTWVPAPDLAWSSWTWYEEGQYVYRTSNNTWYRCTDDHFAFGWDGSKFTVSSWSYRASATYSFDDVVHYNSSWYRYINASSGSGITPGSNAAYWENALSGSMHGWNTSLNYNLGDVVYHSGTSAWYRCTRAHTGQTPSGSSAYWANTPLFSTEWDAGRQYSQNDTVRHNGVWYLSLQNSNINQNPATDSDNSHWIGADTANTSYKWSNATSYSAGAYRCYGGVWYRCVAATTANANHTPNNTTYWTAAWSNSWGITTGAPVVYAEATVNIPNSPPQKTQLRAPIAPAPLFPNAAGATEDISANSGGTVDSYDSTIGTPSATQYSDQLGTSNNYSAIVAAGNTSSTAVTLSSPTIQGYVAAQSSASAPHAPLMALGTSTIVKGSAATPSPKVDPSRVSRSPYIPQFTTLPGGPNGLATNWATIAKGVALSLSATINIGTPGATTPARYYYDGDLTLGTGSATTLNINGPVILYINGTFTITNSGTTGRVNLYSDASAEIHVAKAFRAYSGGDGIASYTYDPSTLIIICDSSASHTHLYSEGTNPLYGVFYAPYTTLNGGYYNNNNSTHIYGAISAVKINFSGADMNIHYDTSLRYATFGGVDQPYAVTEWRELPAAEQATMP